MSIVIGICGGSASGKSTFTTQLKEYLGSSKCAILSLDNYYIDFTGENSGSSVINYDQPNSIEMDLLASHINSLIVGKSINSPLYDYKTHKRLSQFKKIVPADYLLVEGLFLFNMPQFSALFNVRVFINTSSYVRFIRRIRRDMEQRDRGLYSIIKQYAQQVRPMYRKYVEPNSALAHIIIAGEIPFSGQIPDVLQLLSKSTGT
jgi:uridine kinase